MGGMKAIIYKPFSFLVDYIGENVRYTPKISLDV